MKKPIGIILSFSAFVIISGCSKEPESVNRTSNPAIKAETLFNYDDCTVYRFSDGGRDHYFVKCKTSSQVIETHAESCGKGCSRTIDKNIHTQYE